MIDGMDGIRAGYHFAGTCGVTPRGWTLRQLWMMANGRKFAIRQQNLEIASLVWGLSDIDWESYLLFGEMSPTGRGGPVELSPETRQKVEEEIERIRRENPGLPKVKAAME
jgi:hypothetical protein